jgi:hypothetical protein
MFQLFQQKTAITMKAKESSKGASCFVSLCFLYCRERKQKKFLIELGLQQISLNLS